MAVRCPKCRGLLVCVAEFLADLGEVAETIKCVNCGNRVASRPRPDGVVARDITPVPSSRPYASGGTHDTPPCVSCGRPGMLLVGRGLCNSCWKKHKGAGTLDQYPRLKPTTIKAHRPHKRKPHGKLNTPPCASCGRPGMNLVSRGLCCSCHREHKVAGTIDQFGDLRASRYTRAKARLQP